MSILYSKHRLGIYLLVNIQDDITYLSLVNTMHPRLITPVDKNRIGAAKKYAILNKYINMF